MAKNLSNRRAKSKRRTKPYIPSERETTALKVHAAHQAEKQPSPSLAFIQDDNQQRYIAADHEDQETGRDLLMKAIGTTDVKFLTPYIKHLANAGIQRQNWDDEGPNFLLSVVKSIEPRNEIEAMLAAQLAAVHVATMAFARRLAHVENIPQQDSAERAFNKLTRTFTTQMEALKKYRDAPQQRVHVEHVHVNEGGQAIVGNVKGGGRQNEE